MSGTQITNPKGAFVTVSDYTTYVDATGNPVPYYQEVCQLRANEAITVNQLVGLVAATASVPLSVEPLDVSDAFASLVCIGVALEAASTGDLVSVCIRGPVLVNIDDTGTCTLGDVVIKHATTDGAAGNGGTLGGTWDAADVAGTALGVYLGAEVGTSNKAPIWFQKF